MIKELKTIKITSKRQISIPKSFDLLKEGDFAIIKVDENRIIIEPIRDIGDLKQEVEDKNDDFIFSNIALLETWNSKEDEKAFAYFQ